MKRKESKSKKIKRRMKWLKWRWEFGRRNPDYRKKYRYNVPQLRRKGNYSPGDCWKIGQFLECPYLDSPQGKKEAEFCRQFGFHFGCMIDPKKSYDDLLGGPDSMEKACFIPATFWETWARWSFDGPVAKIEIDFSRINSLMALQEETGGLLEILFKYYYKNCLRKKYNSTPGNQKRLVDYDRILMVGDMKEKRRLLDRDIAKELFPKDFEDEQTTPWHLFPDLLTVQQYKQH
jgi:hypothetical protein